jgi:hypothetical protein
MGGAQAWQGGSSAAAPDRVKEVAVAAAYAQQQQQQQQQQQVLKVLELQRSELQPPLHIRPGAPQQQQPLELQQLSAAAAARVL